MKCSIKHVALVITVLLGGAGVASAHPFKCTSSIKSNFNGTAIAGGDFVWFNSDLKVNNLGTSAETLFVTHATITFAVDGVTHTLSVPDSQITFSPSITLATTEFTTLSGEIGSPMGWRTKLPSTGLAGNDFMGGLTFRVPVGGLPGGIQNIVWKAEFSSDSAGLTVNWQWAAAAYSKFDTDYNELGVKPVDDNKASIYQNSDHAGTPENFKTFVIGGARGGGGSNFTGSLSGTGSCALTVTPTTSITESQPQ